MRRKHHCYLRDLNSTGIHEILYDFWVLISIMSVNRVSICLWAGENPAQRNIIRGDGVLHAEHILKCGVHDEIGRQPNTLDFLALCIHTSQVRGSKHEIAGQIKNRLMTSMRCSINPTISRCRGNNGKS